MREGELEARPGGLSSSEGLSWGSGREQESAWEGERDSTQKQQPAGQREGKAGRRGAEAGAGDRGRKAPRLGVSDQTDGKG